MILMNHDKVYSEKLINILATTGVRFETFPVTIVDYRTRSILPVNYMAFHLLEEYSPIDTEKVKGEGWPIRNRPFILDDEIIQNPRPFFRLYERQSLILIHKDLRNTLEAASITGCRYIPIQEERW